MTKKIIITAVVGINFIIMLRRAHILSTETKVYGGKRKKLKEL